MSESRDPPPRRLWFREPASEWIEGFPIGNGRLGAMVLGDPTTEELWLNEETLWAGRPIDRNNPDAREHLPEARRLLLEGQHGAAEEHIKRTMLGSPARIRPFQALGRLRIAVGHEGVERYRRELDLRTGIASVSYEHEGTAYTRECFVSGPDDLLVLRMDADGPGSIDARLSMDRERDARGAAAGDEVLLRGQIVDVPEPATARGEGGWGLRFESRARVRTAGGETWSEDGKLHVEDADALTVFLTAGTSFEDGEVDGPDPTEDLTATLADLPAYEAARRDHVVAHRDRFDRVTLAVGDPEDAPTDERLAAVEAGGLANDPDLAALYFQFGRYLLLASSGPRARFPATLQGLWCAEMDPPWDCDYHMDINVQMNYWPAEVTNLADCVDPYVDFVDSLREPGHETARIHYGCDGFIAHTVIDIWGSTTPNWRGGVWPTGTAWVCRRLIERTAFDPGVETDERIYPILRDAAQFLLDYLVETDAGELVTVPSISPEHWFVGPDDERAIYCVAPTMDLQLIADLFGHTADIADRLDVDAGFAESLRSAVDRLPDLPVADGRLLEWTHDPEESDPGHRHLSHLYGVFPGDEITVRGTPELADAARAALERRVANGSGQTGWSRSWVTALWARFEAAEEVEAHLETHFEKYTRDSLLDVHPMSRPGRPPEVFQIDGNFGGTAAIAESLLQSHDDELRLLPACPPCLSDGTVSGLKARGGYEVDIEWADGQLVEATVHAERTGACRVRTDRRVTITDGRSVERPAPDVIEFPVEAGESVQIVAS